MLDLSSPQASTAPRACPPCNRNCNQGRSCPARNGARARFWRCEFDDKGRPFVVTVEGNHAAQAISIARLQMHLDGQDAAARCVACVEVSA